MVMVMVIFSCAEQTKVYREVSDINDMHLISSICLCHVHFSRLNGEGHVSDRDCFFASGNSIVVLFVVY